MRYIWLKRAIDVTAASVGLVVLAPLMICVAAAVRFSLGSPVLFRQPRPGLGGKPFLMYKFRTMLEPTVGCVSTHHKSPETVGCVSTRHETPLFDGERLTRLGRFLRATSLDELPELWNVLRGEMSLVGPRPLLMEYLDRYTPRQARRHEVKPGITGWAQINGRNAISWEKKFDLDVWYVDNWSISLDVRILLSSIHQVVFAKGISADSHPTMPKYSGPDKTNEEAA